MLRKGSRRITAWAGDKAKSLPDMMKEMPKKIMKMNKQIMKDMIKKMPETILKMNKQIMKHHQDGWATPVFKNCFSSRQVTTPLERKPSWRNWRSTRVLHCMKDASQRGYPFESNAHGSTDVGKTQMDRGKLRQNAGILAGKASKGEQVSN